MCLTCSENPDIIELNQFEGAVLQFAEFLIKYKKHSQVKAQNIIIKLIPNVVENLPKFSKWKEEHYEDEEE